MIAAFALAAAVVLSQTPAVVVVTSEAELETSEPTVADDVARALSVRLTGRDVEVSTTDDGVAARWSVSLASQGVSAVAVTIRDPEGRIVRQGTLSFKRRTRSDVASTIAIWSIEALTPVMPELASQRPELALEPSSGVNVALEAQPRGRDHFAARIGVGGQSLIGGDRLLGQLELGALWLAGESLGLLIAGDVSTSFDGERDGARLEVRRGGLVAALEWRRRIAFVTVRAHLGPMLRGLRIDARGGDLLFAHRTYVDPGAQLSAGASIAVAQSLDVGVALRLEGYLAHPTLLVDDVAALETGSGAVGLVMWLEPHF